METLSRAEDLGPVPLGCPTCDFGEQNGESATEWYCRVMGEEWGPMSTAELMAVARRGRLTRDDTVRPAGKSTWVRAELVYGLFNAPPVATTVTSDRFAASRRAPAPARRSVRKVARTHYWLKIDEKIAGPFTGSELQQLAERGALKPHHQISKDRQHWTRAGDVKGLSFSARCVGDHVSSRSAVLLEKPLSPGSAPTACDDAVVAYH
jgi:hypothetical protein